MITVQLCKNPYSKCSSSPLKSYLPQFCISKTASEQKTKLYLQNRFSLFATDGKPILSVKPSLSVLTLPILTFLRYIKVEEL